MTGETSAPGPSAAAAATTHAALRDPNRLEALREVALLDTPTEQAFDRLTRLASWILDAPVALVSLVGVDRQFFKSCVGLPEPWASQRETPLSHSFCQYVVGTAEPFVVEDARVHDLVRDNLAIPDLGVVAYAGVPLITADGHALGSFCVIDHQPRRWTRRELAVLGDLAASVITEIELRAEIRHRVRVERERAALLERERVARQDAEKAARLRDEVLAVVAHDLRGPLTGILTTTALLQHTPPDEGTWGRRLTTIRQCGEGMNRLIRDLVDVAAIELGQFTLRLKPTEVAPLLASACEVVQPQAAERRLTLECHAAASLPPVLADRGRVLQVLGNLLGNAVRHTPEGGRITATAERVDGEVRVTVTDTGQGVAAENLPHVFERFWRAEDVGGEGVGLGLAIARGVVEAHGGRIWAESREGEGSTFGFTLPITPDDDRPGDHAPAHTVAASASPNS